ncbi:MAG TPA: hydrogenase expression/formation protein HypE [Lentisphaeria bacterium]|nr:MAG: hydrogenase expression/formation protein HypE [Lentisphaerae bacterium GWF2_38_69]HBM15067.1 hydrogenase expression/formation protein HypE [Lentisphaeria bacterium]
MSKIDTIQLAHGGGGRLSDALIRDEILSRFGEGPLKSLPDGATLPKIDGELVFSTDSYVVKPYKFNGGNIGNLAVHGTVNDISVSGGIPRYLSLAMIIEEGFPISELRLILDTIKTSADECDVKIVTGDTKVVARGQCDSIYINTSGIGEKLKGFDLGKHRIKPGDAVIVSGNIGDHGMAILAAREGINIDNNLVSDTASVQRLVQSLHENFAYAVKFMRDPTRGGVAAVLNEIVSDTSYGIELDSVKIPYSREASSIAEMLGIELLNVACEGRMLLICDNSVASDILNLWKNMPEGKGAEIIGYVNKEPERVSIKTVTGGRRLVDVPTGELLPRIC